MPDVTVNFNVFAGTNAPCDNIAAGIDFGFGFGHQPHLDLLIYPGVIFGACQNVGITYVVDPGVSDIGDMDLARRNERGYKCCPHGLTASVHVFVRLKDACVRHFYVALEKFEKRTIGIAFGVWLRNCFFCDILYD